MGIGCSEITGTPPLSITSTWFWSFFRFKNAKVKTVQVSSFLPLLPLFTAYLDGHFLASQSALKSDMHSGGGSRVLKLCLDGSFRASASDSEQSRPLWLAESMGHVTPAAAVRQVMAQFPSKLCQMLSNIVQVCWVVSEAFLCAWMARFAIRSYMWHMTVWDMWSEHAIRTHAPPTSGTSACTPGILWILVIKQKQELLTAVICSVITVRSYAFESDEHITIAPKQCQIQALGLVRRLLPMLLVIKRDRQS